MLKRIVFIEKDKTTRHCVESLVKRLVVVWNEKASKGRRKNYE